MPADAQLPLHHPIITTLIWTIGLTARRGPAGDPRLPEAHPGLGVGAGSEPRAGASPGGSGGTSLPAMASPTLSVTLDDVRAAQDLLSGVVRPTPLEYSRALSDRVGAEVFLKCENLQRAGSFKIRGAYTRMARLSDEEKARGVVAASAGNHAQGVALAGQLLGIDVKVYMPHGAPMPKLLGDAGLRRAPSSRSGRPSTSAWSRPASGRPSTGAVLIHPFDHPDIVAGQGTAGLEILDQCPDVQTIVVSTGGGGLLAGISVAVRAARPDVRIIGVQAEQAAAYPLSLAAGKPVAFENMQTMADGIAVGMPGDVPYALVARPRRRGRDGQRGGAVAGPALRPRARQARRRAGRRRSRRAPARRAPAQHARGARSSRSCPAATSTRCCCCGSSGTAWRRPGATCSSGCGSRTAPGTSPGCWPTARRSTPTSWRSSTSAPARTITVDEVEIGLQLETRGKQHCEEVLRTLRGKGYQLKFG